MTAWWWVGGVVYCTLASLAMGSPSRRAQAAWMALWFAVLGVFYFVLTTIPPAPA